MLGRGSRTRVAASVCLMAVVSFATAVGAQTSADITLQPNTAPVGGVVDVTGAGFPGNVEALLYLDRTTGAPLVDGVAVSRTGAFATEFVVPSVAVGDHSVIACWRTSPSAPPQCPTRETLRVVRPPTTTATTAPPRVTTTGPRPTDPPLVSPTTPVRQTTTTAGTTTTTLGSVGIATTTTTALTGPDGLAGQNTTTGLGFGELVGDATLPDLRVTGLEITQSVQNLDNEMPLVTGHMTVVRVYVRVATGTLGNISGALLVERGGNEVAVAPPVNGPISTTTAGSDRLDANATLNFVLPPAAIGTTGSTKFTAFVYSVHPSTPFDNEPASHNNFGSETVTFHAGTDLVVRLFPVHMHDQPDASTEDVTFGGTLADLFTVGEMFVAATRYLPVASISALGGPTIYPPNHDGGAPLPPLTTEFDLSVKSQGSLVNGLIFDYWEQSTPANDYEQFYGLIGVEPPMGYGGLSNYTTAHGRASVSVDEDSPWYHSTGGKTLAHELAHNVEFEHNLCKGNEASGGAVEPYPYAGPPCRLAPLDPDGWYGFDIAWQSLNYLPDPTVVSNDPDEAAPNAGFPVMGYKNPRWADPFFWCRQLEHFGVNCTAMPIPENDVDLPDGPPIAPGDEPVDGQQGWLRVSALFDRDTGVSTLYDTRRVDEPLDHVLPEYARRRAAGEPTELAVQLVDSNGDLLGVRKAFVEAHAHDEELFRGTDDGVVVHEYVPWIGAPAAIELRLDGVLADRRVVSAGAPTVEVATPTALEPPFALTWTASDPDGDALTFNVRYSPDGGDTWTLLARALTANRFTVDSFDLLAGGDAAHFEVEASDGVHSASSRTGPVVVPNGPPTLTILSPADDRVVPLHQPVALRAATWDREGGVDTPPEVTWESSRDGALGDGEFVLATDLTAGEHEITATATDSAGQSADASITIVVDETVALPMLDEEGQVDLLARLRAGSPDEAGSGGGVWRWAVLALGFAAFGATAYARRRRSLRA